MKPPQAPASCDAGEPSTSVPVKGSVRGESRPRDAQLSPIAGRRAHAAESMALLVRAVAHGSIDLGDTDVAKIYTLLARYLNGTGQRNEEIREEIRAPFRALGLRPPV